MAPESPCPPAVSPGQNRGPIVHLLPILTVNFIGTLGYSIVMPFLVYLVAKFGGNAVIYGVLGATYSIFQFVGAPLLGRYSDRFGRRRILFVSQLGTLLAWVLFLVALLLPVVPVVSVDGSWLGQFTLSLPLIVLFVGRALDGLTGGNISVANAYLVDVSTEESRKGDFGKMAAASNLGFIVGPVLAGLLGATALGEVAPTLAAILVSIVGLAVIVKMLPDPDPTPLMQSPCESEQNRQVLGKEIKDCYEPQPAASDLRRVLRLPNMPLLLVLYFTIFLAFNIFYTAFPVHAATGLGWEIGRLGVFFAVLSGMMMLVQGPLMSWIGGRLAEPTLVIAGSIGMVISFVLLHAEHTGIVYLAAGFFALGNGVMWPSFLSILGGIGSRRQQGYIQGVASSSGSLASVVGLTVGGVLYTVAGPSTFALAAVLFALVCLLSVGLRIRMSRA